MYLWVVLTTFLAMIAAYVLPIRQDTQEVLVVPVAQAKMITMVAKHKAAVQYMKERSYPFFSNETAQDVAFVSGNISDDDLREYMPYGFDASPDYANFTTVIYCMKNDMSEILTGTDIVSGFSNCRKTGEDDDPLRMLITYGPIPERWQTRLGDGTVRPSTDMIAAMRGQFSSKMMVGYTVEGGPTGLQIVNYENVRYDIPKVIVDDDSIADYTVSECAGEGNGCLVYMMWR